MAEGSGCVCHDNVPRLLQTLSYSVLDQTFANKSSGTQDLVWSLRRPSKQPAECPPETLSRETVKLTRLAFDVLLLRGCQCHGAALPEGEGPGMTAQSRCLAYRYYMDLSGRHDDAKRLEKAVLKLSKGAASQCIVMCMY